MRRESSQKHKNVCKQKLINTKHTSESAPPALTLQLEAPPLLHPKVEEAQRNT